MIMLEQNLNLFKLKSDGSTNSENLNSSMILSEETSGGLSEEKENLLLMMNSTSMNKMIELNFDGCNRCPEGLDCKDWQGLKTARVLPGYVAWWKKGQSPKTMSKNLATIFELHKNLRGLQNLNQISSNSKNSTSVGTLFEEGHDGPENSQSPIRLDRLQERKVIPSLSQIELYRCHPPTISMSCPGGMDKKFDNF